MLSPLTRQLYYLATYYDNHYPDLLSQVSRYRSRWEPQYHLSLTPSSSSANPAHVNAKSRANPCGTLHQSRNAIMKLEAGRGSVTLVEIGAYASPEIYASLPRLIFKDRKDEGRKAKKRRASQQSILRHLNSSKARLNRVRPRFIIQAHPDFITMSFTCLLR